MASNLKKLLPLFSALNPLRYLGVNTFLAAILIAYALTHNYLFFHSLSEIFSIVMSFTVFVLAWNSKKLIRNNYFIFVGISYFFVGSLDLLDALMIEGMGIFPNSGTNVATQLWITSRFFQFTSLLIAPFFIEREVRASIMFGWYLLTSVLAIASIFYFKVFPVMYLDNVGFTPFKSAVEYLIIAFLVISIFLLWQKSKKFDNEVLNLLIGSLLYAGISEAFLAFSVGYNTFNLIGHIFKVISFYLFYIAIVRTGINKPLNLLFLELKRKESQVLREKAKIEEYLNISNSIFIVLDKSGKIMFINRKGEELIGKLRQKIVGRNWFTNFLPTYRIKPAVKKFRDILRGETKHLEYMESPIVGAGGTRIIGWHNALIKDKNGRIKAIVRAGSDITDHIKIEDELKESEVKYKKLFNNKLSGMAYCKLVYKNQKAVNYTYLDVNKAFEEQTGLKREDVIGKKVTDIFPEIRKSDPSYINKHLHVGLTGEEIRFEEFNEQLKKWFSIYAYSPKKKYFISIFNDITAEKELQRRKDEFISIASHELKTPITSIKIFSEILDKRLKGGNDVKSSYLASSIHDQTIKLTQLISDLLDVTKIQEGKLHINKSSFDMNQLVKKIVTDFQHTIENHKFIREGEIVGKIVADEIRISQVINNLLTNAAKYSPDGGKIIVRLVDKGDNIEVSVEDFGIGIPDKVRKRIFNRFYRGTEVERRGLSGFGLGLYISNQIVKRHSGKIWVESKKNKGSKFTFTLPKNFDQMKINALQA